MKQIAQTTLAAVAIMLASGTIVSAQAPDSRPCTPQERSNKTLSQELSTNGVICPPDIDPGMKAPAPNTGKMPVIPPPGTPGGDPNVQPK